MNTEKHSYIMLSSTNCTIPTPAHFFSIANIHNPRIYLMLRTLPPFNIYTLPTPCFLL